MIYNIDVLVSAVEKLNYPDSYNIHETMTSVSNLLSEVSNGEMSLQFLREENLRI